MKAKAKVAFILFLSISLAGCVTLHVVSGQKGLKKGQTKQFVARHRTMLFFNMINEPIDLNKHCKNGKWQSIKLSEPAYAGIVAGATLGIISPIDVRLQCAL